MDSRRCVMIWPHAPKDLFLFLQSVLILTDEVPDLVSYPQELFPLLAIERDWKSSQAYTESPPFSLTLSEIWPRVGFFSASFSARSRSISAFKSCSDAISNTDSTIAGRRPQGFKHAFGKRYAVFG